MVSFSLTTLYIRGRFGLLLQTRDVDLLITWSPSLSLHRSGSGFKPAASRWDRYRGSKYCVSVLSCRVCWSGVVPLPLNQQCADSGYRSICTADQMSVLFFFWLVFKSCSFHSEHHECLCTFHTHEAPPVRHLFPHLSQWWLLRLLPPLRLSHKWCPVLLEPGPLTGEGTSSWCTSGHSVRNSWSVVGTLTSWRTSTSKPAVRKAWNPPQVPQATSCNLINIYQLYLLIDHKS